MVQTPNAVPLGELRTAIAASGLTCVQLPDPTRLVHGVVVHVPDDPPPADGLLVLCTDPRVAMPDCTALVIRAGMLESVAAPDRCRGGGLLADGMQVLGFDRAGWYALARDGAVAPG